ncbi:MAG TPA: DUF5706 domain-containing protein [Xanthomonadaceae bacterium]|nr:DUF5706 domain-containing protein [Xanthomonadaceae bacterium]
MSSRSDTDLADRFAAIPERNTSDNILRTAQQIQVQLSMMADTKANIVITVSSIVLTLSLGRVNDPDLGVGAITLSLFTMLALLLAILAVVPKYRPLRLRDHNRLPAHFNLLFFGHFAELSLDEYLDHMSRTLKPDGSIYQAQVKDLYGQGRYLSHHKYRYLRLSYVFFLSGFLLATLIQAWKLVFG